MIWKAYLCLLALSTMQILLTMQGRGFLPPDNIQENVKSLFFVFKFFDVSNKIGWERLEQRAIPGIWATNTSKGYLRYSEYPRSIAVRAQTVFCFDHLSKMGTVIITLPIWATQSAPLKSFWSNTAHRRCSANIFLMLMLEVWELMYAIYLPWSLTLALGKALRIPAVQEHI